MGGAGADAFGRPTKVPGARLRDAQFNAIGFDLIPNDVEGLPSLVTPYYVAIILTVTMGAPNTEDQFHAIEMSPGDVGELVPAAALAGLGKALGPILEVRVAPSPTTVAQVKWDDSEKLAIEAAFGIGGKGAAKGVDLSALTINAGRKGMPLDEFARAIAASVYASLADRAAGSKTVPIRGDLELAGWVRSITHTIATDGVSETRLDIREGRPKIDPMALLPDAVRRIIMRQAQGDQ